MACVNQARWLRKDRQRRRAHSACPSGELATDERACSRRNGRLPSMRQPKLRKPRPHISRHASGQSSGYARQGAWQSAKGKPAPECTTDRGCRDQDPRRRKEPSTTGSGVPLRKVDSRNDQGGSDMDAPIIRVPPQAIELAKRFEGFHHVPKNDPLRRAHTYICPAGYHTIGYGHLCKPDHPPVTQEVAEAYLAQDLIKALNATLRYCPVLAAESETRLAAIVDFTFNLGAGRLQTSTLRRRINQRDWPAARQELRRWVYGGGKVLPGLVTRREAEVALLATD